MNFNKIIIRDNTFLNFNGFYNIFKKYMKIFQNENTNITLGRWCHVGVPKCNHDVIMKKLDFANMDNNLSPRVKNVMIKKN